MLYGTVEPPWRQFSIAKPLWRIEVKGEVAKSQPPAATLRPSRRPSRFTCHELVELASLEHYLLRLDRRCRLVVAKRTTAPFNEASDIRECFRSVELKLAEVPRASYHLLVDARHGPSRNDRDFERVLSEQRGKLLFGFARNAALAATAAGRLQIQRFAKADGRNVLTTDDPAEAFEYLGLCPHIV